MEVKSTLGDIGPFKPSGQGSILVRPLRRAETAGSPLRGYLEGLPFFVFRCSTSFFPFFSLCSAFPLPDGDLAHTTHVCFGLGVYDCTTRLEVEQGCCHLHCRVSSWASCCCVHWWLAERSSTHKTLPQSQASRSVHGKAKEVNICRANMLKVFADHVDRWAGSTHEMSLLFINKTVNCIPRKVTTIRKPKTAR